MTAARIVCQVPGCMNSSGRFARSYGYLCSRHWRMVPRWMKRRRAGLAASLRRRGELVDQERSYSPKTVRAQALLCGCWDGMVRAAIRRALGL